MNEIDKIAERYAEAVYRKDEAAFLSLYADGVVVSTCGTDGPVRDALLGLAL